MAIRNAKSRPHCVDIAPSAYATRNNPDASRDTQRRTGRAGTQDSRKPKTADSGVFRRLWGTSGGAGSTRQSRTDGASVARTLVASSPRGGSYRQADIYTGAVRRTNEAADQPSNLGKLATAFVLITGAVVWTTGASDSLAPAPTAKQETLQASVIPPAFFFDDDADALERKQFDLQKDNTTLIASFAENNHDADNQQDLVAMASTQMPPESSVDRESESASLIDTFTPSAVKSDTTLTETTPDTTNLTVHEAASLKAAPVLSSGLHEVTVELGDTLSGILNENGLKADQMNQLLTNDVVKDHLSNIDVGQILELTLDDAGDFRKLTTRVNNNRRVNIERTQIGFDVTTLELPIERQRVATSGKIDQSLYLAAERADLKQSTIMELANIFQWELDFARDIRKGDGFSLVYDRLYREGEYIGDGDILAAEFIRGGKSYNAIRFTTDEGTSGYYSPEGESKRRTFMRHPVDVVRITSKFDPNRLHPVLHQIRAHRGVDYGSPHGSPIYATADGRVTYSGTKNAYGKTVVLKHGEKFSTLYAHMSRISKKSQVGKRVKQGDVIGYVGNTGRVTGTHLHYEFRVNGKQIDPLKVELPAASPIDKKYRGRLKALAEEMSLLMARAHADADKQVAVGPSTNDGFTSGVNRQ